MSTTIELDSAQQRALEAPLGASLAIVGVAGSGKTGTLLRRALRLCGQTSGKVLVTAPVGRTVDRLSDELEALAGGDAILPVCIGLGDVAAELLSANGREVHRIDEVRASHVFEEIGARLFDLDWTEFVSAEVDPEITGLRVPQRFSAAAYRLIRRLRNAHISPAEFEAACFKGATWFYGHTPNLMNPELLNATRPRYRDSLNVGGEELLRQYARERDLIKILVKLYESYVESLVAQGCLTDTDAIFEATELLRAQRNGAALRYAAACIDDAQDLTEGQMAFIDALFGAARSGVTVAGDPAQATLAFSGARGSVLLENATEVIRLEGSRRCPADVLAEATRALPPADRRSIPQRVDGDDAVQLYRASSPQDEARFVGSAVRKALSDGLRPERIAVIVRHLDCAQVYVDALLARGVPIDIGGAASLFEFRVVEDALAALWALADPFRNETLSRNLEAPWLNLSDATIAALCAEPSEPQTPLFEIPEQEDEEGGRRWDRSRALRLGYNVLRGDVDRELPAEARERLAVFRAALERWERLEAEADLTDLARIVLGETVLAAAGSDARGRFERGLIARLIEMLDDFATREPLGTLADFLSYAGEVADADSDLLRLEIRDPQAVAVLDVEAAKGREFDRVFVVDVRAGAFPRYYSPDAFLFTPRLGMIPKENVGAEARAARTAKYTYALHRLKLTERYNAQERRAFYCAATRARERLYVSASGSPTRGFGAPEILEELRNE